MRILQRLYLLALCLTLLSGCATQPLPSVNQFLKLESDPRVRYEPGADAYARQVAGLLPQAIRQVESAHARPFSSSVEVFVCASVDCFAGYVRTPNLSAATVRDNRVFLGPQLFGREAHRLQSILTHELSHLHLGQQIGHYTTKVPAWFHEGLAALASNGGGADYATDAQAIAAIRQGKMFAPEMRDTPSQRHTAEFWGLDVYTFYRQSMLFVGYLRDLSMERFQDFLQAVQDQEDFDLAFGNAYNMPLGDAATRFRQSHHIPQLTTSE